MIDEKNIKDILTINFEDVKDKISENIPDYMDIYSELVMSDDIDEELTKSHIMYSYCVFLSEEFLFQAKKLSAELDRWAGEKWRKLKTSDTRKYTDNDAKKKIESYKYYVETKILIAKYEKLYKQLAFGGGKSIDMKVNNLKTRINMILKSGEDFNVMEEKQNKVKKRIKKQKGGN